MKETPRKEDEQPPEPPLAELWQIDYEMRTFTEIVRDWLPWRKKKRITH